MCNPLKETWPYTPGTVVSVFRATYKLQAVTGKLLTEILKITLTDLGIEPRTPSAYQ